MEEWTVISVQWTVASDRGKSRPKLDRVSGSPYEGKGDRLRWMRCQPERRTLLISLSIAPDSDLTANLSPALRAARVEAVCPSEACVRAGNFCGGEPSAWSARDRKSVV